jgi:gamma-glutamyl hercynylcysteine S-oxide synthase
VVGVSFYEAEAFAEWSGKTLPTEAQWERAARGTDGREYPWGDKFDGEKCNTAESGIGKTTRVTRYPNGISPDGCYDMAGNVWEWTASKLDENTMVLRGGSWVNDRDDARCAYRFRLHPFSRLLYIGFRCVRTK